jgi:Uma2 family endonuclease
MTTVAQRLTLQEFSALSDLEESPAWELIDGQISQKPMPTSYHSILQKRLVNAVDQAGSEYEAFPELRCVLQAHSIVPDIVVIHRSRIPVQNAPIAGAPDWLIEILSPDQSTTKLIAKIQICLQAETQLGWLIDLQEQVILVFWQSQIRLLQGAEVLPVLAGMLLQLTPEQIFG